MHDLMTGEIKWKKRGSGKGSAAIIAADGCIYVCYADGTVALGKATPDEYTELGTFKVPGSGDRPVGPTRSLLAANCTCESKITFFATI